MKEQYDPKKHYDELYLERVAEIKAAIRKEELGKS